MSYTPEVNCYCRVFVFYTSHIHCASVCSRKKDPSSVVPPEASYFPCLGFFFQSKPSVIMCKFRLWAIEMKFDLFWFDSGDELCPAFLTLIDRGGMKRACLGFQSLCKQAIHHPDKSECFSKSTCRDMRVSVRVFACFKGLICSIAGCSHSHILRYRYIDIFNCQKAYYPLLWKVWWQGDAVSIKVKMLKKVKHPDPLHTYSTTHTHTHITAPFKGIPVVKLNSIL